MWSRPGRTLYECAYAVGLWFQLDRDAYWTAVIPSVDSAAIFGPGVVRSPARERWLRAARWPQAASSQDSGGVHAGSAVRGVVIRPRSLVQASYAVQHVYNEGGKMGSSGASRRRTQSNTGTLAEGGKMGTGDAQSGQRRRPCSCTKRGDSTAIFCPGVVRGSARVRWLRAATWAQATLRTAAQYSDSGSGQTGEKQRGQGNPK